MFRNLSEVIEQDARREHRVALGRDCTRPEEMPREEDEDEECRRGDEDSAPECDYFGRGNADEEG